MQQDDERRIFVSRIPPQYTDDDLRAAFESKFGAAIDEATVVREREAAAEERAEEPAEEDAERFAEAPAEAASRRFGFVVFADASAKAAALSAGTLKVRVKSDGAQPQRVFRMRLRDVDRDDDRVGRGRDAGACFLWARGACVRGDACAFSHAGPGSCAPAAGSGRRARPRPCWRFRKGSCEAGDACEFSHDACEVRAAAPAERKCFRWEKRGRCNKGDACEFVHSGPGGKERPQESKPKREADEAGSGEQKQPEPKQSKKNKKGAA